MSQIVNSSARPTEMRQRGMQPQGMERAHSLERRIPIAPLPGQFHIHGRRFNANRLAPHFLSHPTRRARANERIENDSTFRASERNRIFHKVLGKGSIVVFAVMLIFREDIRNRSAWLNAQLSCDSERPTCQQQKRLRPVLYFWLYVAAQMRRQHRRNNPGALC